MGVCLEVVNDSAHTVTPRFYLCEKQTFAAQSARMVHTGKVLFGTGDCVPARTTQTITKALGIPPDLTPTFFNCSLMKQEYRLKVCRPAYASTKILGSSTATRSGCKREVQVVKFTRVPQRCQITARVNTAIRLDFLYPHALTNLKRSHNYPPKLSVTGFFALQVSLEVPLARDIEVKLPLVILLGDPKPHQQNPKRSIWFRKLCGQKQEGKKCKKKKIYTTFKQPENLDCVQTPLDRGGCYYSTNTCLHIFASSLKSCLICILLIL